MYARKQFFSYQICAAKSYSSFRHLAEHSHSEYETALSYNTTFQQLANGYVKPWMCQKGN